jgi:PST family polysaccharide transporter
MALRGFGYWALVWRELVVSASYAAGVWLICRWIPGRPRLNSAVRSSLRFGANLSGNSIIQYITTNLDRVLIGRFFGATFLGFYSKAFQLVMMPIEQISSTIFTVGLSPLSSLQSDSDSYRRFYRKMLSVLSFLYMPFLLFLAIQSEDMIRLLFGEAWLNAAPFLRILSIGGIVTPILRTCQLVMISRGMSKRFLHWGIMSGIIVTIAYATGTLWGAIGVAYAYTIANYTVLILMLWFGLKYTPVSALLVVKTISLPVISGIGASIIMIVLLPSIPGTSILVKLVSSFLVFEASYLGIWLSMPNGRRNLADYWSHSAELLRKA